MHILKIQEKLIPKRKNSFGHDRRVPEVSLSGKWLADLGWVKGYSVTVSQHPTNPNALIIERVLL